MSLQFPFQDERLKGPPPPSLPSTATQRWRPLVPVTIFGAAGQSMNFGRALVDPGADDTIFPMDLVKHLSVTLHAVTGHGMRWRGQQYALRYGDVELEIIDNSGASLRWPATVAFTRAKIRYPLLGVCGCLEFMDVRFFGDIRIVEFGPNASFPGTQKP